VFVINVWGEWADSTFIATLAINGRSVHGTVSATTGDTIAGAG
jgi:hypothetical protein